jgi:UDP-glucose 4-epimerase
MLVYMRSVVLVTGGAGFIGSHVVDRLVAAGLRPRILDQRPSPWHRSGEIETVIGDVRRLDDVLRAAQGCSAICHLAAAADVAEVHAQPAWATELNTTGTLNVLEAARQLEIGRVVYASTVWVYSDVDAEEVDEEDLLPQPAHLYTAGKLAGEMYCRSYAELYGLRSTVLRFGIPYGPRARPAAVIPSFVARAHRGEPLTIAGTGDQERSFVYVEDLADGVVRGLAPEAAGRTYNLAGTETTTIRKLAELVCEEVATTEIVHAEGRAGDLRGARIRCDRAQAELGWSATTPLREGVRRYACWMREQDAPPPAPVSAESVDRRRARVLARLAAVWRDPISAGVIALLAVASAAISVILGTTEATQAADLTVVALGLAVPLWALTVTPWPAELRGTQARSIVMTGLASVVLLGLLSGDTDALHGSNLLWFLTFGACVSGLLRVVPQRLAQRSP